MGSRERGGDTLQPRLCLCTSPGAVRDALSALEVVRHLQVLV